jgi:DNA replication protein DnaC
VLIWVRFVAGCDDFESAFTHGQVNVLFSFFGERYEKQRSVLVTTNLAFDEWEVVLRSPMTATAVVHRIVHRSVL